MYFKNPCSTSIQHHGGPSHLPLSLFIIFSSPSVKKWLLECIFSFVQLWYIQQVVLELLIQIPVSNRSNNHSPVLVWGLFLFNLQLSGQKQFLKVSYVFSVCFSVKRARSLSHTQARLSVLGSSRTKMWWNESREGMTNKWYHSLLSFPLMTPNPWPPLSWLLTL